MQDQARYQLHEDPKKGICFMLLAMFLFALANGVFKGCELAYGMTQVVFFRNFYALFPCAFLIPRHHSLKSLKTSHILTHALRGLGGVISLGCLFQALKMLPLAEAIVLSFTSTLFLTTLSYPLLGEAVGKERWVAIGVGFLGVVVMANPTGQVFNWGVAFILVSAFVDALLMLHSRHFSKVESSANMTIYYSLFAAIFSGLTLPWVWVAPPWNDFMLLVLLGVLGGVGQYFVIAAYRFARAGTLAPMIYTALIWNVCIGAFIYGEKPTSCLIIGATLIIGAGLYVILSEKRKISSQRN
jgi:drug/metabolite transporter (DMT)-like permease